MIDFIIKYWVQILFSIIVSVAGAAYAWLKQKFKKQKVTQAALTDGVEALLHDRLYQAHAVYQRQAWISAADLKNIEHIYRAYHTLGGNGTGTQLYQEMQELPKISPQKNGEET